MEASSQLIRECGHWRRRKERRLLPRHRNAGLEIVYVSAGEPVWHIGDRQERVPAGSVFFTLPWQPHGSVPGYDPEVELSFVVLALDREYPQPVARFGFHPALGLGAEEAARFARRLGAAERHAHASSAGLAWLLPRLVDEALAPGRPGAASAVSGLARLALIELVRSVEAADPVTPASGAARRVAAWLAELPGRSHEAWTLERMAAACGLGRSRFSQLVREQTGQTPVMVLNRRRIERACRLLAERPDRRVTDIALDCGYRNLPYFSRVFREYTGHAPSALRRGKVGHPRQML